MRVEGVVAARVGKEEGEAVVVVIRAACLVFKCREVERGMFAVRL